MNYTLTIPRDENWASQNHTIYDELLRKPDLNSELHKFLQDMYEREINEHDRSELEKKKFDLNETSENEIQNDTTNENLIVSWTERRNIQNSFIDETIELTKQADSWQDILERIAKTDTLKNIEKNMLNKICSVKLVLNHKKLYYTNDEQKSDFNNDIKYLQDLRDYLNEYKCQKTFFNAHLFDIAHKLVVRYMIRKNVGRQKGKGKYVFVYNDKTYTTIQSCADDYNISKQAMHKRLKKLHII